MKLDSSLPASDMVTMNDKMEMIQGRQLRQGDVALVGELLGLYQEQLGVLLPTAGTVLDMAAC